MNFRLIKYAIQHPEIKWVDLAGGREGTWRDILINRSNSYKWTYVPESIKENPNDAKPYVVKMGLLKYSMYLEESTKPDNKLKNYIVESYVNWIWFYKKRRIQIFTEKVKNKLSKIITAH